jgi:predicted Zn finger-like uncharacterized protein
MCEAEEPDMIAACPKCAARYRIERERLEAGAVRLRCARCEAVFRVRPPLAAEGAVVPPALPTPQGPEPQRAPALQAAPPTAPASPPSPSVPTPVPHTGESVLIAMPDGDLAKRTAELLSERGCAVLRAADGVEAMLEIQRKLPRAVVLAADLPKMFGFQICEIVKRNPSLRGTWVVLVGAIHHQGRYRREAADLYGADVYLEGPDLPEGLLPLLAQGGLQIDAATRAPASLPPPRPQLAPEPARLAPPRLEPAPPPARSAPIAPPREAPQAPVHETPKAPVHETPKAPVYEPPPPPPVPLATAAPPRPKRDDGLEQERAKAERLARIVISDIVLYNEERFTAAARAGNVFTVMAGDLAEGRALFEERIDARVRAERDHLKEELLRSAKLRGMR